MDPLVADALVALAARTTRGLVVHDTSGVLVWCNQAAEDMLGLEADELAGKRGLGQGERLTHADGTPLETASLPSNAVLGSDRAHAEAVIGLRDDRAEMTRWLEMDSYRVPVGDDDDFRVASTLLDISDRYDTRSEVAAALRTFQLSLRPGDLASVPGVEIDARCRPATGTLVGGGDFYDVVSVDDETVAFFVGDMQGHGIGPATETYLARHTLRAASFHADSPSAALAWLHKALVSSGSGRSCTAAFGTLKPSGDRVEVRYSLGGHPHPLLLRVDGRATFEGDGGTLLGSIEPEELPVNELVLEPGSALVFYTDGLTDACHPRLTDDDLLDQARWRSSAAEILEGVMKLCASDDNTFSDDTAVLVIAVPSAS